jgi:hypothetical protein
MTDRSPRYAERIVKSSLYSEAIQWRPSDLEGEDDE